MNPYRKIKDFHGDRLKGLGSSDIRTLAGMNKRYKQLYRWTKTGQEELLDQTIRTLWLEKTSKIVQVADKAKDKKKKFGNIHEPIILREFIEDRWGEDVAYRFYRNASRKDPVSTGPFQVKVEAFHPEYPFCLAHTDLLIDGELDGIELEPWIVEAKSTGFMAGKRREGPVFDGYDNDDRSQFGVPDGVFLQWQWQAFCFGVEKGTVCPLIDTNDYREYGDMVYDPRSVEGSLALAQRFWYNHVIPDKEPTPTTWGDVLSLYPDLADKTAMVSGEEETKARVMIARGMDLKAKAKEIAEELDDIKAGLGVLAGDVVEEDGTTRRTMNKVLTASDGDVLAKFRDQTKDSLSLSDLLKSRAEKIKKADAFAKKVNAGKEVSAEELEAIQLTGDEMQAYELDTQLRELGAYKTSDPFRVVTY